MNLNLTLLTQLCYKMIYLVHESINQGLVVQNFVSLTLLLSPQFVNYISTSSANTLLFFVVKM